MKNWLSSVIDAYRAGKLSEEKIAQLESIGIVWNPLDELWNRNIQYLIEYREKYGNLNVPHTYKNDDGYMLGRWLFEKIKQYRKGTLDTKMKERLESIGVVFSEKIDNEI